MYVPPEPMSKPPDMTSPVDWLFVCENCLWPIEPAIDSYSTDAEGRVVHLECPTDKKGDACSCPTFALFRAGHLPGCAYKNSKA